MRAQKGARFRFVLHETRRYIQGLLFTNPHCDSLPQGMLGYLRAD